ncbi:MAG: hypothetical protein H6Q17_1568 [Bacteroidetes bacterium]|jgi:hypothetical protein|nr:hypothetical protein [Bacteroidota bacterium]
MTKRLIYIQIFVFASFMSLCAQGVAVIKPLPSYADSIQQTAERLKKKPLVAVAEVVGLNLGVWGMDYLMGAEFAKISFSTMKYNIAHKWVWDNDQLNTNLFAHPYHGGLYFAAARSNGMNFWQSLPYSFCGSLMWETLMETEPPAINDLMATTLGGAMMGEMLFRLSSSVYDDSKSGTSRIGREILGGLLSPMQGFNRLITGKAWHVRRNNHADYFHYNPTIFEVFIGGRYLSEKGHAFQGAYTTDFGFTAKHGNPFEKENYQPYDWFNVSMNFGFGGGQPTIGSVNAVGLIAGRNVELSHNQQMVLGIYQHFNFFDSNPVLSSGSNVTPYQIAETVSFGPGLLYRLDPENEKLGFVGSTYANFVLLGASLSDHYQNMNRKYSMGQGFSLNLSASLQYKGVGEFGVKLYNLNIYTWKGYPAGLDLTTLTREQQLYLNAQGDKGRTSIFMITPTFSFDLSPSLGLVFEQRSFIRTSNYVHFPIVRYATFDAQVALKYKF